MKKKTIIFLVMTLLLTFIISSCSNNQTFNNTKEKKGVINVNDKKENDKQQKEESKRISLCISAIKAAFHIENGGDGFIAVKGETLKGFINDKSKQDVLEGLKDLSEKSYWYEDVKEDKTLFRINKDGSRMATINGTVLSVQVKEYKENEAVIAATSWFGNLGAVFPEYKALYKDGVWKLKLIKMAIS